MRNRFGRRGLRFVLVGGIVFVAAAGAAYATHTIATGGPSDPLYACAADPRGTLRAVDDASQCASNEKVVKLQRFLEAQSVTVDCAAGEKVADALAQNANAPFVQITIKGTCTESVFIGRDRVALVGFAAGDGLAAPAGQSALNLGGRRIFLEQLTLTGGPFGISAFNGAQFVADNVRVTGAGFAGIGVTGNADGTVSNSTVENGGGGVSAARGGVLSFFNGTIRDNTGEGARAANGGALFLRNSVVEDSGFHGIIAYPGGSIEANNSTVRNSGNTGAYAFGGSIQFSGGLIEGSTFGGVSADEGGLAQLGGVTVARNGAGGVGASGGSILMQGATIESNNGDGVRITTSSSVSMRFGVTIRNNTGNGVSVSDNSVANFGNPPATGQILDNGKWGIHCDPAPSTAVIRGAVGTVSGNAEGQNDCPNAGPFG